MMYNHRFIIGNQQRHDEYNRAKKDYFALKNSHLLLSSINGGAPEKVKNQIQPKISFLSEWKRSRMDRKQYG
jgi:hypothetical protein